MGRVLLVGASWPERALLNAQLAASGHEVRAFDNGRAALQMLVRQPWQPEVVVVDLARLSWNPEVWRDLRALVTGAPLVVLADSLGISPDVEAALRPMVSLRRPVRIQDVVDVVQRLLVPRETSP